MVEGSTLFTEDSEATWTDVGEGTILIIDDNPHNRELLRQQLQRTGLTVLEAINGKQGLQVAQKHHVDIIILDIMMPGIYGYESLKHLRSDKALCHIPIIVLSSVNEPGNIARCIETGAEEFFTTPCDFMLLKARICACLDRKHQTDKEQAFTDDLELAQKKLETAIESIDEGFAIFDSEDHLVRCNAPFKDMYSSLFDKGDNTISYGSFLRENLKNGIFALDRCHGETPEKWFKKRAMWHKNPQTALVERNLPLHLWIEMQEYKTPDGGTVCIHKDITRRKKREEHLAYLALHDPLTGVANRTKFEQSLDKVLHESMLSNTPFSVLFLDLDGFKAVNDFMGHEFGDHLLISVAQHIQSCIRAQDLVARRGGDEFAVLLPNTKDLKTTKRVAERIVQSIGDSLSRESGKLNVGVSVGIAMFPDDGCTAESLLEASDKAMYAAKKAGKGQYKVYSEIVKKSASG